MQELVLREIAWAPRALKIDSELLEILMKFWRLGGLGAV